MNIQTHTLQESTIAEITADKIIINSAADGLDLVGNLYYQNFDKIILHASNLTPAFFDLKNGLAGEILQKFSNYRLRLAIVGDFTHYTSKSIRDFMHESNKGGHINFVASTSEALKVLSNQ